MTEIRLTHVSVLRAISLPFYSQADFGWYSLCLSLNIIFVVYFYTNEYLIHYRIQKCAWDSKTKILELKINVCEGIPGTYMYVWMSWHWSHSAPGHCTRSQQFSMSSRILWLQCLVSSVQHVPWLKIKQSLRSGVCRTIRPLTPSQTQAQTPATMRLLATFLVAAVLHDQVSHTIHELVSVKLSSVNTQ